MSDLRSRAENDLLHTMFEAHVALRPDAVALEYDGGRLTYRELNERANRVAHLLRAEGVGPNVRVAFYLDRTEAPVVALLAILKAGGAYVPIDPVYPTERREWIVSNSNARLVLTTKERAAELRTIRTLRIDDEAALRSQPTTNLEPTATPDDIAYVIYTSGSTGRPKGSLIPHRNVVRLLRSTEGWFGFGPDECFTIFHSFAFDFSVWETWGALAYGGRAIVVSHLTSRSPEELLDLLVARRVTVLNQTPSAFRQIVDIATTRDRWKELPLRWVIFGGEALDIASLAPWFERYGDERPRLVNMYGITETTVHVTYRPLRAEDARSPRSVIGEPIPDMTLHVLDDAMRPVPVDTEGELYVGGAGLSHGYLGLPELTAQRFVPDPFTNVPGARLYRSGDTGRRLADGDIEYLGRADTQVKIRGFRIEVGEIEHALRAHERVRDAVVIAREDVPGDKRLVAYVIARDSSAPLGLDAMREHLRPHLPEYMIPSAVVAVSAFPLTANGKLDRAALPKPDPNATVDPGGAYDDAPEGALEGAVAAIVHDLLAMDRIGATESLFDLGFHSVLLMRLIARVDEEFGVSLSLRELFKETTIRRVAELIAEGQAELLAGAEDLQGMLDDVAQLSDAEAAALLATEKP